MDQKSDALTIHETDLQDVVVKAIQKVWDGKDMFLFVLEENINAVLENESGERIAEIDCTLDELHQELLRLENGKKGIWVCCG